MFAYLGHKINSETNQSVTDVLHICFRAAQEKKDERFRVDEDGVAYFDGADAVRKEMIKELVLEKK